jgi:hypothetical protein
MTALPLKKHGFKIVILFKDQKEYERYLVPANIGWKSHIPPNAH